MGAVDVENPFPFSANRVQKGIDPQRSRPKVRFGSFVSILSDQLASSRIVATLWVGAIFQRGVKDGYSSRQNGDKWNTPFAESR